MKKGKKYLEAAKLVDKTKLYTKEEAIKLVKAFDVSLTNLIASSLVYNVFLSTFLEASTYFLPFFILIYFLIVVY